MALYAPVETSEFQLPPSGLHVAICCDVVDLGVITTQFGQKHKLFISWLLNVNDDEGRPMIASKRYTVSLHEKANLYTDLCTWYNRRFTPEECQRIDLDKLVNRPCQLQIMHQENGGRTYANVVAVLPHQEGMPIVNIGDYVRHIHRPLEDNPKDVRNPALMHAQQPQNGYQQQQAPAQNGHQQPPVPAPVQSGFAPGDDLPF